MDETAPRRRRPQRRRSLRPWLVFAALLAVVLGAQQVAAQNSEPDAPAKAAAESTPDAGSPAAPAVKGGTPQLAAKAWVLIDPRDGTELAAKAASKSRPVASTTKLMTAFLALKKLKVDQKITAPAYRALAAESLLGLRAGERMTVRDLMYALVLVSANDAAVTLAEGVSGSQANFVELMNSTAASLGLDDTSYANPIGLDDPNNFSSARDLASLAQRLLDNRLFARIADTEAATLRSGDRRRRITTRNTLLLAEPKVTGVKTGHTLGAGYVLVASEKRSGTELISAVLGAASEAGRDSESAKLLDYGFSLYKPSRPVKKNAQFAQAELADRDGKMPLVALKEVRVSVRSGQQVETGISAPDRIDGAVKKGEPLGKVTVTVDGKLAGGSALVAARSEAAPTFLQKLSSKVPGPGPLVPLALLGILVVLFRRKRGPAGMEATASRKHRMRTPEERREMHQLRQQQRAERKNRRQDPDR